MGRQWSQTEDARLSDLWDEGYTVDYIADNLIDRTPGAVRSRAAEINLPKRIEFSIGWSQERVASLIKYWGEGLSYSQIARVLGGGLTRNAVTGKVMRLGLPTRKKQAPCQFAGRITSQLKNGRPPWPRKPVVFNKTTATPTLKPDDALAAIAAASVNDVARVSLNDLDTHHCRFPVGEVGQSGFGFCGSDAIPGLPYCKDHAARCFSQVTQKAKEKPITLPAPTPALEDA